MSDSCKVLVVDDDSAVAESLQDVFTFYGLSTLRAANLADAVKALRYRPTAIVLDLSLPDGGGIQLLRRIRSGGDTTPVCVLTGTSDLELAGKVRKAGADKFLRKPFEVMDLMCWIRSLTSGATPGKPITVQ